MAITDRARLIKASALLAALGLSLGAAPVASAPAATLPLAVAPDGAGAYSYSRPLVHLSDREGAPRIHVAQREGSGCRWVRRQERNDGERRPAHIQHGLCARLLDEPRAACIHQTQCTVRGRIRIMNRRGPGTGRLQVCVGMDVHTARHRDLTDPLERDAAHLLEGYARLRPGQLKDSTYLVKYNSTLGRAHHLYIDHIHAYPAADRFGLPIEAPTCESDKFFVPIP
jgi:hypothetical protein